ncbi:MAG: hypothetical protein HQL32_02975 [Planctomycetes bacterium]|nr:hypothetical protein [Planctomycetota bacterium]
MSEEMKLRIGMPAGSLANASRGGNLITLLESAGFKTSGYESGGPSSFKEMNHLYGWDGRPQEFGSQLGVNELDVAIAGDDWIKERLLELEIEYDTPVKLEKILSLKRGGVRIVGIANPGDENLTTKDLLRSLCKEKKVITVVSEMPYLALNWIQENLKEIGVFEQFSNYSVQKYKSPAKIDKGIVIYETWGKTEAKVKNEGADFGLEITQSGSAIRNYGLQIIDTIMNSETGIWINPNIRENEEKCELLKMFLLNLYGSINAENKVLVVFNVLNQKSAEIEEYLKENSLFADEPTMNLGKEYSEYSIQIDTAGAKTPLAKVRFELAKLGACSIDTIPINSSIPNIDVLDL